MNANEIAARAAAEGVTEQPDTQTGRNLTALNVTVGVTRLKNSRSAALSLVKRSHP